MHLFEMLGVDAYGHVIFTIQAIGQNDGGMNHRRRKAVGVCRLHVVNGIVPAAGIQGCCIGQKGLAACFHDLVYNLAHQSGVEVRVVAVFAKMQLDGGKLFFLDDFFQIERIAEARYLGDFAVLVRPAVHICIINCGGHGVASM